MESKLHRAARIAMLAAMILPSFAMAAPSKEAVKKAERMAKVGKSAYKKGKFEDAVIAFRAAYKAVPEAKYLYNLARCFEKNDALPEAYDHYQRYLAAAPNASDREAVETQADFLKEKLQQTMAWVELDARPMGAAFELSNDKHDHQGDLPWMRWVQPGRYTLTIALDGHRDVREKIRLKAGQRHRKQLTLTKTEASPKEEPAKATATPAAAPTPGAKPAEAPARPLAPPPAAGAPTGAWTALALAGTGLAAFAAFAVMQRSKTEELENLRSKPDRHDRKTAQGLADEANSLGQWANISLGVAVVGAVTGGWLLVSADDGGVQATMRTTW